MIPAPPSPALDDVAHTIQVALTPVFLLSGIGTLINVFASRLARVGDQIDKAVGAVAQTDDAAKRSVGPEARQPAGGGSSRSTSR